LRGALPWGGSKRRSGCRRSDPRWHCWGARSDAPLALGRGSSPSRLSFRPGAPVCARWTCRCARGASWILLGVSFTASETGKVEATLPPPAGQCPCRAMIH